MPDEPMVGIVVVSHSAAVAESTVELVRALANLSPDAPRLVAAGGMVDGAVGTDAARIAAAIGAADAGSGVVVLADLGGAVLATQLAVDELLDGAAAGRVRISSGPIVEGAFIGAVQASAGDGVDEVLAAANEAGGMDKLGSGS